MGNFWIYPEVLSDVGVVFPIRDSSWEFRQWLLGCRELSASGLRNYSRITWVHHARGAAKQFQEQRYFYWGLRRWDSIFSAPSSRLSIVLAKIQSRGKSDSNQKLVL